MSTIDELFFSDLGALRRSYDQNDNYKQVSNEFDECEKKLTKSLRGNNKNIFDELIKKNNELIAYVGMEEFKAGFKLGAEFIMDILEKG